MYRVKKVIDRKAAPTAMAKAGALKPHRLCELLRSNYAPPLLTCHCVSPPQSCCLPQTFGVVEPESTHHRRLRTSVRKATSISNCIRSAKLSLGLLFSLSAKACRLALLLGFVVLGCIYASSSACKVSSFRSCSMVDRSTLQSIMGRVYCWD